MANPYHDSTGQFCSKGEMQASIVKLNTEGKTSEALALMADLKAIEGKSDITDFQKEYYGPRNPQSLDYGNKVLAIKADSWSSSTSESFYNNKCEAALFDASDERVEDVARILAHEENVYSHTTYADSLAEIDSIQKEVQSKTGFESHDALYTHNFKEKLEAETEGNKIVDAISSEAEKNGLPHGYSSYYFDKTKTELGLAPDKLNTYDNSIIRRPENITTLSASTFPVKVRNKEHKAILANAVATVFARENTQATLERMNARLKTLSVSQAQEKESKARLYNTEDSRRRDKVRERMLTLTSASKAVNRTVDWRSKLRDAGVKTNATKGTMLSSLSGSDINVGKDGKVNNIWAVNVNPETQERSLDKITSVKVPNSRNNGGNLTGESGRTYLTGTHYRNFSSETTDAHIIVDETVQGDKPFAAIKSFKSLVDSGD